MSTDAEVGPAMASDNAASPELPPEGPRENMITTAVKFLQNPKVRPSPLSTKKAFLQKKGLTDEEIKLAIDRSGTAEDLPPQASTAVVPVHQQVAPPPPPVSAWVKARDFASSAMVAGGLAYLAYKFYHKYIVPYLYGTTQEQEQMKQIQKGILELQESMAKTLTAVQQSLQAIQEGLDQQQEKLQDVYHQTSGDRSSEAITRMTDVHQFSELKQEITSLKGLLLNRNRFPATPAITPILPEWQRAQSTSSTTNSTNSIKDSTPSITTEDNLAVNDDAKQNATDSNNEMSHSDMEVITDSQVESSATEDENEAVSLMPPGGKDDDQNPVDQELIAKDVADSMDENSNHQMDNPPQDGATLE